MCPYFNIFGIDLPAYGICMTLGFAFALIFSMIWCKKNKVAWEDPMFVAAVTLLFGIVGAKLLSILTSYTFAEIGSRISKDPLSLITDSGLVFYGGLLLGIPAAYICARMTKVKLSDYENLFITVVPAAHAFGRVGCFLSGCCYGKETVHPIGIAFSDPIGGAPAGVPLIPIQLFEAAYNLLLFGFLLFFLVKFPHKKYNLPIYLVGYATERFVVEMFRADEVRGFYFGLSTSQWISIGLVIAAVVTVVVRRRKKDEVSSSGLYESQFSEVNAADSDETESRNFVREESEEN